MKNALGSLILVTVLMFAVLSIAADKVVVVPLSTGTNSINYRDVVSLEKYVTPDSILPLVGGTIISPSSSDYTVPANKMLVVTTVNIWPKHKTSGTYYYFLELYRETPPRPGPQSSLWTFQLADDGGGESRAYHFSPGLIIPEGDLVTLGNSVISSDGARIQLIGYLINK